MNLPWYGCSRWTCFVRSRSGRSRSDHERSRSISAYSASCVAATAPSVSTARVCSLGPVRSGHVRYQIPDVALRDMAALSRRRELESSLDALQAAVADGDDVERREETGAIGMRGEP